MNEAAIHLLLRSTARTTFIFFFFAFSGGALRDLLPSRATAWLAQKRNWFLVAVAVSHTLHLAAIIMLLRVVGWSRLPWTTAVGGGIVYLLIYALAVNSMVRINRGPETLLGTPRFEAKFEAIALYLIWLVFAAGFVPRMVSGWPIYTLLGAAALLALVLRIACLMKHRRAKAVAA
jgi:methionine sulfoxide reductase heme-binding subunit